MTFRGTTLIAVTELASYVFEPVGALECREVLTPQQSVDIRSLSNEDVNLKNRDIFVIRMITEKWGFRFLYSFEEEEKKNHPFELCY